MRRLLVLSWCLLLLGACSSSETREVVGLPTVEPQELDFGTVLVGDQKELSLAFHAAGSASVRLALAEEAEPFGVQTGSFLVPANGTIPVRVRFAPVAAGPAQATLRFVTLDEKKPRELSVRVRGVGVRALLGGDLVDFGPVRIGSSKTVPYSIANPLDIPIDVELKVLGAPDSIFSVEHQRLSLEPLGSATTSLSFSPTFRGDQEATLQLRPCPACGSSTVTLRGQGAIAEVRHSPTLLDFGFVPLGSIAVRSIELYNPGDVPALLEMAELLVSTGSYFLAQTDIFPLEIAPGERREVEVRFAPPADGTTGQQRGFLAFYENADDARPLLRTELVAQPGAPVLVATPDRLDFGVQPLGRDVPPRQLLLENAGLPADVLAEEIRIVADDPEAATAFSVTPFAPLPHNVGRSPLAVQVTYRPSAAGVHAAVLEIPTDLPLQPLVRVELAGQARITPTCSLQVLPEALRFGLVAAGRNHLRTLTVRNAGTGDCFVWDFALDPGGSPDFVLLGAPADVVLLPQGESLALSVRFRAEGTPGVLAESTLSFSTSAPGSERIHVPVSGMPSLLDLRLEPLAVDFGQVPAGSREVRTATLHNEGTERARLLDVALESGANSEFSVMTEARLPLYLEPTESVAIEVAYRPNDTGHDDGYVRLPVEGYTEPLLLPLRGTSIGDCGDDCIGPVVHCPQEIVVERDTDALLEGQVSHPVDRSVSCSWRLTHAPDGALAGPEPADACSTTLRPDLPGIYRLELSATDSLGNQSTCSTRVRASLRDRLWIERTQYPEPPAAFIELTLLHPDGGDPLVYGSWFYHGGVSPFPVPLACNSRHAFWEGLGPSLDWDVIGFQGDNPVLRSKPPNANARWLAISIEEPIPGRPYHLSLTQTGTQRSPTRNLVRLYCDDQLAHEAVYDLGGERWVVHYFGSVEFHENGCTFTPASAVIPRVE